MPRYCVRCPDGTVRTYTTQIDRGYTHAIISWRTDQNCPRWVFDGQYASEEEATAVMKRRSEWFSWPMRIEPLFIDNDATDFSYVNQRARRLANGNPGTSTAKSSATNL